MLKYLIENPWWSYELNKLGQHLDYTTLEHNQIINMLCSQPDIANQPFAPSEWRRTHLNIYFKHLNWGINLGWFYFIILGPCLLCLLRPNSPFLLLCFVLMINDVLLRRISYLTNIYSLFFNNLFCTSGKHLVCAISQSNGINMTHQLIPFIQN